MSVGFGEPVPYFLELEPLTEGVPRVRLTIYNAPASGQVVQVRRTVDGETSVVPGLRSISVADAGVFIDWAAPLNREAVYTVYVDGQPVSSASVMVESDTAWVQDPLQPGSAIPVSTRKARPDQLLMTGEALKDVGYALAGESVRVMGDPLPRFFGGTRQAASGINAEMVSVSNELSEQFRTLIAGAPILLLRTTTGMQPLPALCYLNADIQERPVNVHVGGSTTRWNVTGDLVKAVLQAALSGQVTYGQVQELLGGYTYGEVRAAAASTIYLDWQKNPLIFMNL